MWQSSVIQFELIVIYHKQCLIGQRVQSRVAGICRLHHVHCIAIQHHYFGIAKNNRRRGFADRQQAVLKDEQGVTSKHGLQWFAAENDYQATHQQKSLDMHGQFTEI